MPRKPKNHRKDPRQLDLFPIPPDTRSRRDRGHEEKTYAVIISLRRKGESVYRAEGHGGRMHVLNGRLVTSEELIAYADLLRKSPSLRAGTANDNPGLRVVAS